MNEAILHKRVDRRILPDHPPILWKDKPGSPKLLEQCRKAAETWLAAAKANGRWKGKDKEDFLRHSEGLGIKTDG
jgi:hypothetical protein